ncbi:DUF2127 domain-containing protein [Vibrio ostreicida]|uniref:DUF2127 domain-containing protein n=1 Tax=Vibrio ostreicida TaxID=526588 RepID=UPI003B5B5AE2
MIALLEGVKGLLSLIVAIGLHTLAGQNLQQWAESLVLHAHLNPAHHLPGIFIQAMEKVPQDNIPLIISGAIAYTVLRWLEAYGLWRGQRWTEWLALVSSALYIPFEIYGLVYYPGLLGFCVLFVNLAIVIYIARSLFAQSVEGTCDKSYPAAPSSS